MQNLYEKVKSDWTNEHKAMTKRGIKLSFHINREYTLAKDIYSATPYDNFMSLSLATRDRIVERWITTQQRYHKENSKRVYYLSMEFLIGRLLGNFIVNLGLDRSVKAALEDLNLDFDRLRDQEADAGLGNGGLGRLAACFIESMATLQIPAHGYGIRYDYGIFHQKIQNGYQLELPDEWLRLGCPWEFARPEYTVKIRFYGKTEEVRDENNNVKVKWVDTHDVLAVPYDTPVVGYKNDVVNTLRLWSARSTEEFDLDYFNDGDYEKAVYQKIFSENISKILYPNDNVREGRELRLKQEYFFTAASIADILRRFKTENSNLKNLPDKAAIQLNDTHPALGIVELMRVLIDEEKLGWESAWDITKRTFAYTNHTLMPEALECWSTELFEKLLPRHLQIVYEINDYFLNEVRDRFPKDGDLSRRMSIIENGEVKRVRMAHLSIVGSHSVNGVSALHTDLIKTRLFQDFDKFYPGKFNNKTNGITQRQWLLKSNRGLSELINHTIGEEWVTDLEKLKGIESFKEKGVFRKKWQQIKTSNKENLAEYILKTMDIKVDPQSLFDVQIKRMHEYKRQLLFAFYMIAQYLQIKNDPSKFIQPRTFIVGGKSAPGYFMAKLTIKFINSIADVINRDKDVCDKIQTVFLENYRVSLAEKIFPASDLSEQISTAGTEASGTGNMKFMLNGALTIGTYDGANVEIAEAVEENNIFIFGLKTPQVEELRKQGYQPAGYVEQSAKLKEIHALLKKDFFCKKEPGIFDPIIESVFQHDPYLICADFESYCQAQDDVSVMYQNKEEWTKKSIINVARSGRFSSDRTIRQYAQEIWGVPCGQLKA